MRPAPWTAVANSPVHATSVVFVELANKRGTNSALPPLAASRYNERALLNPTPVEV